VDEMIKYCREKHKKSSECNQKKMLGTGWRWL